MVRADTHAYVWSANMLQDMALAGTRMEDHAHIAPL